jgi:hypothetical protein
MIAVSPSSRAAEKGLAACVADKVTFTGIVRLRYATVAGSSGNHVYLHDTYPGVCAHADAKSCRGRAYILPGQAVAIGKECGKWAYVQYIGAKRITTGWVPASRLSAIVPPPEVRPRTRHSGSMTVVTKPRRYRFKISRAAGVPVCEAYLQRLNQTSFYNPPYCGRPESKTVPGFAWLTRVALTRLQTLALYPRLEAFNLGRRLGIPQPLDPTERKLANLGGPGLWLHAWRYEPEVDISNSGKPRNVVVWSPAPPYDSGAPCGFDELRSGEPVTSRPEEIAFIANEDTTRIEDGPTLKLFGNPTNGLPVPNDKHERPFMSFVPIGDSFGVFEYRNLTYYDTFYAGGGWPDFQGKRTNLSSLDRHLAVFLRRRGVTREVCEYTYPGGTVEHRIIGSAG